MENKLGKFLREKRGKISLRDFARKLDISHTYLDSLEKGYDSRNKKPVRVTVDTLSKIANALNEPLDKLVAYSENKEHANQVIEFDVNKIIIALSKNLYSPPTKEQQDKIEEFAKFVLKDNLIDKNSNANKETKENEENK